MVHMLKNLIQCLFGKPATRLYPFVARPPFDGARGMIEMDPNICVYCGMCQKRCPTNAITVARKPNSWTLDPHRCIVCSYCVEVCPKHCIYMRTHHRAPTA